MVVLSNQINVRISYFPRQGLTQLRNELAQLTRDGLLASLFDASNITRKPQPVAILQGNKRMRGKVFAIWTRTKYKGLWDVSPNLVHQLRIFHNDASRELLVNWLIAYLVFE